MTPRRRSSPSGTTLTRRHQRRLFLIMRATCPLQGMDRPSAGWTFSASKAQPCTQICRAPGCWTGTLSQGVHDVRLPACICNNKSKPLGPTHTIRHMLSHDCCGRPGQQNTQAQHLLPRTFIYRVCMSQNPQALLERCSGGQQNSGNQHKRSIPGRLA